MNNAVRYMTFIAGISGALIAGASASHAAARVDHAFGYADHLLGSWDLNMGHTFNPAGPTVFERLGVGSYRYTFGKLSRGTGGGNAQARAHGNNNRCTVVSWWISESDVTIQIACTTPSGAPVDTVSVVQYYAASGTDAQETAYLWADQPATLSYRPAPSWTYNSTGAQNEVAHGVAIGEYLAFLPGLIAAGGNPHVTAYGPGSQHCKITSWYHLASGTFVAVRCFDATGAPVNTRWSLRYTNGHLADDNRSRGIYFFGDGEFGPGATPHVYVPALRWNTAGIGITVEDGTVTALATLTGMATTLPIPSSLLITGVGHDSSYCTSGGWTVPEDDTVIWTYPGCFDRTGVRLGSAFSSEFKR